jgi:hypothetical protein
VSLRKGYAHSCRAQLHAAFDRRAYEFKHLFVCSSSTTTTTTTTTTKKTSQSTGTPSPTALTPPPVLGLPLHALLLLPPLLLLRYCD